MIDWTEEIANLNEILKEQEPQLAILEQQFKELGKKLDAKQAIVLAAKEKRRVLQQMK